MELKKAKVILLPTEKLINRGILVRHLWKGDPKLECRSIWQYNETKTIGGLIQYTTLNGSFRDVPESFSPHNMHIVKEGEELNNGDYFLFFGEIRKAENLICQPVNQGKVIATTDLNLIKEVIDYSGTKGFKYNPISESFSGKGAYKHEHLPSPSKGFLKKYCEVNGASLELVNVEFLESGDVNLRNNNTITIRPLDYEK